MLFALTRHTGGVRSESNDRQESRSNADPELGRTGLQPVPHPPQGEDRFSATRPMDDGPRSWGRAIQLGASCVVGDRVRLGRRSILGPMARDEDRQGFPVRRLHLRQLPIDQVSGLEWLGSRLRLRLSPVCGGLHEGKPLQVGECAGGGRAVIEFRRLTGPWLSSIPAIWGRPPITREARGNGDQVQEMWAVVYRITLSRMRHEVWDEHRQKGRARDRRGRCRLGRICRSRG